MIKYALKCADGHEFESWFKDSSAYDSLAAADQISCAVCSSPKVEKMIMAPAIASDRSPSLAKVQEKPLSAPQSPDEAALAQMRKQIEANSDYVGKEFADEARRIHDGESDVRSIWGEATREDAQALAEDGIPVAPLPWISRRDD